jgi:hypothetical protein
MADYLIDGPKMLPVARLEGKLVKDGLKSQLWVRESATASWWTIFLDPGVIISKVGDQLRFAKQSSRTHLFHSSILEHTNSDFRLAGGAGIGIADVRDLKTQKHSKFQYEISQTDLILTV